VRWNEPAPDGSGGKKLDPEVLTNLINYLSAVDLSNKNVTVDVLGDAYEYLIKRFADENKGGTMAGQFYTPQEVVDIVVRYLKPQKGDTIYDPTCGSGGLTSLRATPFSLHCFLFEVAIEFLELKKETNKAHYHSLSAIKHYLCAIVI
jgi:type I restriction-modification system DNA methylase subunit